MEVEESPSESSPKDKKKKGKDKDKKSQEKGKDKKKSPDKGKDKKKSPEKDKDKKKPPEKEGKKSFSFGLGGKKPKKEEAAPESEAGDEFEDDGLGVAEGIESPAPEPSPTQRKKSIFGGLSRPKTPPKTPPENKTEKRKGSIFGGTSRPKTPPGEKGKGGGMFGGLGRRMSRFIPGASASADVGPEVDIIEEGSVGSDGSGKSKSSERSMKPREMIAELRTEFLTWLMDHRPEYATVPVMKALVELEDFQKLLWPLCKDKGLTQEERFQQLVMPVDQVYHPKNITRRFLDNQFWPDVWLGSEEHIRQVSLPLLAGRPPSLSSSLQGEWTLCLTHDAFVWLWDPSAQDIASVMISRALRWHVANLHTAQAREQARLDQQAYQESIWAKYRLKQEIERIRRLVCRDIAEGMAKEGVRVMRMPSACLRLQCFWRGCRVRIRMPRYRVWVLRRRSKPSWENNR